jgi:hypothetical protein
VADGAAGRARHAASGNVLARVAACESGANSTGSAWSATPCPGEKTEAREDHSTPNDGGDRLSRVEVVFEVAGQPFSLDQRGATLMAENLRVKAAHEPGAEGAAGARAVADAIELRLIEDTTDPVTLDGDGAEAVYYALNVPTGGGERPRSLYQAVKRLHDERLREKS